MFGWCAIFYCVLYILFFPWFFFNVLCVFVLLMLKVRDAFVFDGMIHIYTVLNVISWWGVTWFYSKCLNCLLCIHCCICDDKWKLKKKFLKVMSRVYVFGMSKKSFLNQKWFTGYVLKSDHILGFFIVIKPPKWICFRTLKSHDPPVNSVNSIS